MDTSFELEECLVNLSCANDWHGVIEAGKQFSHEEKRKFLWAWPKTADCFDWLNVILNANHIKQILSIGCGSGLLEWLISQTTGARVVGLELDKSWWKSTYSPKTFIPMKFTDQPITSQFLNDCVQCDEFALLFCYFNNRDAFQEYVRAFHGDFIFIVGPTDQHHIVTDPNPLNPHFPCDDEWRLLDHHQLNDHLSNCISVFQRINNNEK